MNKLMMAAALIGSIALGTAAVAAKAPAPKISKAQAEAIVLKLAPGKITDAEYEYEGHG